MGRARLLRAPAGPGSGPTRLRHVAQCPDEILDQKVELRRQHRPARDYHDIGTNPTRRIVASGRSRRIGSRGLAPGELADIDRVHRRPGGFTQTALDPVALGSMADPLRNGEADAQTGRFVTDRSVAANTLADGFITKTALDRHPLGMETAAGSRRNEVCSFLQALELVHARFVALSGRHQGVTPTSASARGRGGPR
jgi:hypothetical protein